MWLWTQFLPFMPTHSDNPLHRHFEHCPQDPCHMSYLHVPENFAFSWSPCSWWPSKCPFDYGLYIFLKFAYYWLISTISIKLMKKWACKSLFYYHRPFFFFLLFELRKNQKYLENISLVKILFITWYNISFLSLFRGETKVSIRQRKNLLEISLLQHKRSWKRVSGNSKQ